MKIIGPIILCFFLLGSCAEPSEEKHAQEDLLTEEQLIPLLYDTYMYEGALKAHALDSIHSEKKVVEFYEAILAKHNIDRLKAKNTIEHLAKERELLPILEKVKMRIKSKKDSLKKNNSK